MAHDNFIYQGDIYKLSEARKLFIGSKSDSWKPKYLSVSVKGNIPVLELHKKKPKATKKSDKTLTDSFELPAYKVEKLKNARGRSFVCEITASNFHLFLSADEEKQIDILVFLLQTQLHLKDDIRDDIIRVIPENSECQKRIGAKGSNCLLHISPWGLTLVLERSRCLLAQWPLKSIRYYEASGTGHFTIEAGRVAPMGEGVFGFQTLVGEDDVAYDKLDSYIVNTLDRVKPNQRGTKEEIEDYIREHDHLHALTAVNAISVSHREIQKALKICWDTGRSTETFADAVLEPQGTTILSSSAESSARNSAASTHTSSLNVTLERLNISDSASSRSDQSSADSRRSSGQVESKSPGSRPPLPATKSHNGIVPRRSRRRDHSIPRKVDVSESDTYGSSPRLAPRSRGQESGNSSPELPPRPHSSSQPRRHSNPSSVINQVSNTDPSFNLHPYVNQHQHTEFYHLNSPNLKVRKCKSPVVTPHLNKVGRAELLLSMDQSGVRTPSTSSPPTLDNRNFGKWDFSSGHATDEDHKEAQDYLDAIARASQQKYGHNSMDRAWSKMRRDLSGGDGQLSPGYVNTFPPAGYVNIQKLASMEENKALHKRQGSLDASSSDMSRQNSKTSLGDPTLSPPSIHHSRQRSVPIDGSVSSLGSVTASNLGYSVSVEEKGQGSEVPASESEISMRSKTRQDSLGLISDGSSRQASQLSGFSTFDQVDGPVADWLISASCEDLSDHMRQVIYDDGDDEDENEKASETDKDHSKDENDENTYEEIQSEKGDKADSNSTATTMSNDKPPLPFTGLKKFQNKVDVGSHRDRSKSFGYMNIMQNSPVVGGKPQSSAPSAHLIRKMVAARSKQDNTLRKSLSNPNFLNLGSKEHLFNLKTTPNSVGNSGSHLQPSAKQKSRSFGSLFPAIKKALSRESLGQSRSTTPERRSSFSLRRRSSEHEYRRRSSLHSVGEMTIKGIRMTERSRSFRRVRGAKSVESLSKNESEDQTGSSPAANASTSSPLTLNTPNSEPGTSPVKQMNKNANSPKVKSPPDSKLESASADVTVEKSLPNSRLSAPVTSQPVSPRSPHCVTSSIHVSVSESTASMSPAPSPSHLPPPPLPARKPRVSESPLHNGNSAVSLSANFSPPRSNNQKSPSSRPSNYMNAVSINKRADGRAKDKQLDSTTSLSVSRHNRRISDKSGGGKVTGFTAAKSLSSESSRLSSTSETEPSSKNKMSAKPRPSKIGTKS